MEGILNASGHNDGYIWGYKKGKMSEGMGTDAKWQVEGKTWLMYGDKRELNES